MSAPFVGFTDDRPARRPLDGLLRRLEAVPLRTRLLLIVGLLVGAALLSTSLISAYLLKSDLDARVDAELRSVLAPVASQALTDLRTPTEGGLPSSYAFALAGPSGLLATRLPTGEEVAPQWPDLSADDAVVRTRTPFTVPSSEGDMEWRFIAAPVSGSAVVAVGVPLEPVSHTVSRLLASTALLGTGALVLSLVLGHFAVRRAFRPLRRIEDTASAIADGDLTQRVPVRRASDEVTSLSGSLNRMLARIESSFAVREASEERMRQFVADASHELRTPLTTLAGYAALHRSRPPGPLDADGRAEVDDAMRRIGDEAGRMRRLVDSLLDLTGLEGPDALRRSPVDLGPLLRDVVSDLRVVAPDRRVTLDAPDHLVVVADRDRVTQALVGLTSNAVRHTPSGTPVALRVLVRPGWVRVEVADAGPGIPPQHLPHLLERFYRVDRSRSSGSGGSGLGLAVVDAVARAHGGSVSVASGPGSGTVVAIDLPAGSADPSPAPSTSDR